MESSFQIAVWVLSYSWGHFWSRVLLVSFMAALITLIAGATTWVSGAFRLDHDDVRWKHQKFTTPPQGPSDGSEISPLPSQEPQSKLP